MGCRFPYTPAASLPRDITRQDGPKPPDSGYHTTGLMQPQA